VLLQAAGLALLASISPTALLVAAVYLGSARPRLTAMFYLVGATVMSLAMGVVALVILRRANLSLPSQHDPRYELRIGLGVLLLAAGLLVARRKPSPLPDGEGGPRGLLGRLVASPTPRSAFLVGVLVFAPGATFLAAVQVIATARAGLELTALAVIIVVVINVLLVWLPIVLHAVAPEVTNRYLTGFNAWLRAHGRVLLAAALLLAGAILIGNGIHGLL
jgi:hypothetical protein